jgi:hypothetical protein
MDKELKVKWIEALRSGKYQQNRYSLRNTHDSDNPKFCCLGVLADIQDAKWRDDDRPIINREVASHRKGGWINESFSGGLSFMQQEHLSELNDGGSSFTQIADYIEKNL